MAKITDLPAEILLRIFQFYLEDQNQLQLMNILARVCRAWKAICQDNLLWRKFDGTVPFETMKKLCSKGCLNYTKELVLSKTEFLKDEDADRLFSNLKKLEVVNLTQVEQFSKNTISILAKSESKFKEILIGTKNSNNLKVLEMGRFLSLKGKNLTTIKLSHCNVQSPYIFLELLSRNCPNLEHFHFTDNLHIADFPTEYFQEHCSKLKVLHLDYKTHILNIKHPFGFPNLEVFSYNNNKFDFFNMYCKVFKCILFNSPNLKFLSLTNCCISAKVLYLLPAKSVEYLCLSRSKIMFSEYLFAMFKKWCCSLKRVDISCCSSINLNRAVLSLALILANPPIEYLDLSFTEVTSETVGIILEKCQRLEMLQLNGCRNLGRGLKRKYCNKEELKTLFKKVKTPS